MVSNFFAYYSPMLTISFGVFLSSLWYQVWINQGDIILIGLRDYQDAKADVILRYSPDEARNLKTYGELPETGNTCLYSVSDV